MTAGVVKSCKQFQHELVERVKEGVVKNSQVRFFVGFLLAMNREIFVTFAHITPHILCFLLIIPKV